MDVKLVGGEKWKACSVQNSRIRQKGDDGKGAGNAKYVWEVFYSKQIPERMNVMFRGSKSNPNWKVHSCVECRDNPRLETPKISAAPAWEQSFESDTVESVQNPNDIEIGKSKNAAMYGGKSTGRHEKPDVRGNPCP